LRRVLQFLSPGLAGRGTIAFHHDYYRIPDVVTVEVADSDLAGHPGLTVNLWSTSAPDPVVVTLRETARAGLFRGSVPLLSLSAPAAPGQLRAVDGDSLHARYDDLSEPVPAQNRALVDTVPPQIVPPAVLANFTEATIHWETDEPTDALVQFGESVFLGHTAYSPVLEKQHSITFSGLVPDRGYFFKIASRDAAGNVMDRDNNGRLFTFDTLTPLPTPLTNDMELGTNGWKVVTEPGTEFGWRLVAVNNGFVGAAHSPANAWASNPLGLEASRIDSSLISPAIELAGGNVATLRFWHAYHFILQTPFDKEENGKLYLLTNALSPPLLLAEYTGQSAIWEEATFDLTPYMGRTIFLIWHHRLLSYEPAPRAGWALDDLSIAVQTLAPGVIQVTNNLAQARVVLTGPSPRVGQGSVITFLNLPPGRYIANWTPVPFYQTPAPRTNSLIAGGSFRWTGTYTFPDANNNQMSDLWETNFFGSISPERTRFSDSDEDGFTDYAEFHAGTDPNQANSHLRLLTPTRPPPSVQRLQLQWPTVPGRAYRLEGSSNSVNWVPFGDWTQAVSSITSRSVPLSTNSPFFFRIGVRP
jgi:hypothetical protein